MTPQARDRFIAISTEVTSSEDAALSAALPEAVERARATAFHWDSAAPAKEIDQAVAEAAAFSLDGDTSRLQRAAVARLALGHFGVADRLPPAVIDLYPALFERVSCFLADMNGAYDPDFYVKDVRYMLGLTAPMGAMNLDLSYRLTPKLALANLQPGGETQGALSYVKARGWGRWYNHHVDPREMGDFHPRGWTRLFLRTADMLLMNPDVRGVTGVSWLYDPALSDISPNLAYCRKTQVENGAFLLRVGQDAKHVIEATAASETRRKLCERGEYKPVCYAITWPREALLDWARRFRGGADIGFGN